MDFSFPAECRRCGTCCEKGGPTLHEADRMLVEEGTIELRFLVTVRAGETVREPETGRLIVADAEMIKIKGAGRGWTCAFLDAAENRCTRYDHRPAECRAMACWDTAGIEQVMATRRLTRHDLVGGVEGLWDLIEGHGRRCDLFRLRDLSTAVKAGEKGPSEELIEMLRYDRVLRDLLSARGTDPEHLDFLLGRPIERLLYGFGLALFQEEGRTRITAR